MKQYKIIGTIDLGVIEPDGTKKHIRTVKNTIAATWLARVATNLRTDRNMVMDNLFGANDEPPIDGENGISFVDTSGGAGNWKWYAMITTKAHPTANTVVFTGTFTGTAVEITSLTLGKGWINIGDIHGFFSTIGEGGFGIASSAGTSWVVASFGAAQTVTIAWTIEVVAY